MKKDKDRAQSALKGRTMTGWVLIIVMIVIVVMVLIQMALAVHKVMEVRMQTTQVPNQSISLYLKLSSQSP
jgi:Tfp pilus assembly protein PilX